MQFLCSVHLDPKLFVDIAETEAVFLRPINRTGFLHHALWEKEHEHETHTLG